MTEPKHITTARRVIRDNSGDLEAALADAKHRVGEIQQDAKRLGWTRSITASWRHWVWTVDVIYNLAHPENAALEGR